MLRTALGMCMLCYSLLISWSMCSMTESSTLAFRYTAVGIFVLGHLFREAWGKEAPKMQAVFNDFLEVFYVQLYFSCHWTLVSCITSKYSNLYRSDMVSLEGKIFFYVAFSVVILRVAPWHLS
jgi:hypothetical protein